MENHAEIPSKRLVLVGLVLAGAAVLTLNGSRVRATQAVDPQQIVDQFYPQALIDAAEPPGPGNVPLSRESAYVVYDQIAGGAPQTIIAAYSNGAEGAIRVIRREAQGQYSVVFEPNGLEFGGVRCEVVLENQLVQGSPLIRVSFQSFGGPSGDWYFRWDGAALINVGPIRTASAGGVTVLSDSGLLDLDHTGPLLLVSLVDSAKGGGPSRRRVYRLSEQGRYVLDRTLIYTAPYAQPTSQPETTTDTFSLPTGSTGPYVMKIVNGERGAVNRAASGTIKLNGATVVDPGLLNAQVEFRTVSVVLAQDNTLEVTLSGAPGGHIWVYFEDTAAAPVLGTPRIAGRVLEKAWHGTGVFIVNLELKNTGTGDARDVQVTQLNFRTLSGTGNVTYNTSVSPALPIQVESLAVNEAYTVLLYLNVPATVTRFSITENGTVQNVAGTTLNYSTAQSVIP